MCSSDLKTSSMHERLVNPHSALMYMVKDVPTEPTFIYSDINVYLGENIFSSEFKNGRLTISVSEDNGKFLTDSTKIFAYYPKCFESAITGKEEIAFENEEFIITKYKI